MSAAVVRVSPEWLRLREPADAAARSTELAERLEPHPGSDRRVIHDLGGGDGAMGRWLAPRLRGAQHWVVHDRDEDLLELAVATPPSAAVTVEGRSSDVTRLAPRDLEDADLIVASALLDIMSAEELDRMLGACIACGVPMLLALTVTGRVALTPPDSLDRRVEAAFNEHQRRLLGPDAASAAVDVLRAAGAEVLVRTSPWRLDRAHADLMAAWLDGWVAAACEQEPALAGEAGCVSGTAPGAGGRRGARRPRRPRRSAGAAVTIAVPVASSHTRRRGAWWWARLAATGATLGVLVWRVGTGPFLDGLRTVDARALAAAAGLAVLTTVCCAWRWRVVARGLGVHLPLGTAVAAYYRSIFLNVTLPGGVVGDVHRGISHGRDTNDVGRGLRAVAWERSAGQVVQIVLTVAVLLVAPSPARSAMPLVALGLVAAAASVALVARARPAVARDLRDGLLAGRAWPAIVLASVVVVAGNVVMFMIAARTAGATAPVSRMLPLVLLVMLAAALPNIGGWGPREGMTAWAFSAAGLGASLGVATAVVYGVMVFVASLPGAAVLVVAWARREGVADA